VKEKLDNMNSESMSAGAMWDNFNGIMQEAIRRFVPVVARKGNHCG